jgi:hypothetical protein
MCHNQWRCQLWGPGVRAPQASNRKFFRKNKSQFKKLSGVIPRTPVSKGGGKAKGKVELEGIEGREWERTTDEGEGKEGAVAAGRGGRRGRPPRAAFVKGRHFGPPPKMFSC